MVLYFIIDNITKFDNTNRFCDYLHISLILLYILFKEVLAWEKETNEPNAEKYLVVQMARADQREKRKTTNPQKNKKRKGKHF